MPVGGADGMGGGGGDVQLRKAEALRRDMQALKGGDYSNEDLLYKWLSGTPGTQYREESFRDPQWVNWQKERPTQGMADAENYKRMIMEAGDPRGLFSGNITNTRYQSPGEIDQTYKYLDHFNRMTSVLGMDPSKMSTNVQSNLSGNIAPWATTAQHTALTNANNANTTPVNTNASGGAPGTYNAATNSYSPAPSGAGWQPFMNLDEAQNYYGQYANGGPVALRRKMFTMGGNVDKSHGVGLTSGLTKTVPPQRGPMPQGYKTGGQVVPQRVGHQPANHPHRQGNREGHMGWVGPTAGMIAKLLPTLGIGGASKAIKAANQFGGKKWLEYGAKNLKNIKSKQDDIAKELKKFNDIKGKDYKSLKGLTPGTKKHTQALKHNARVKERNQLQASMTFGNVRNELGIKAASKLGQAGRAAWTGLGPATALGSMGMSAFGPEWYQRETSDEDARWQKALKTIGKTYTDWSVPGGIATGVDWLAGEGSPRGLSNILAGIRPEDAAEAIDTTQLEPTQFATAAEQQEKMKQEYLQKIELYKELLGAETQDDNLGTFADTMFAMSGALEEGEGWSGALRSANQALGDEVKSRRAAKQDINTAAVNQAFADITGDDQMLRQANLQALAAGDTGFLQREQIQAEAMQREIPPIDPFLDDGGELDTEELSKKRGQVFVDYTAALAGGFYLAVDMNGNVAAFNSLERAIAHAGTTTA